MVARPVLVDFLHILPAADKGATTRLGYGYFIAADIAAILFTNLFHRHFPSPFPEIIVNVVVSPFNCQASNELIFLSGWGRDIISRVR